MGYWELSTAKWIWVSALLFTQFEGKTIMILSRKKRRFIASSGCAYTWADVRSLLNSFAHTYMLNMYSADNNAVQAATR